MSILEVRNLVKEYDGFKAVKGVDFSIEKGEIFGFLGPNGAGKTTTLNMLTGLAKPSSGSINSVSVSEVFEAQTFSNFIRFP